MSESQSHFGQGQSPKSFAKGDTPPITQIENEQGRYKEQQPWLNSESHLPGADLPIQKGTACWSVTDVKKG